MVAGYVLQSVLIAFHWLGTNICDFPRQDGMQHVIDDCLTQSFSTGGMVKLQSYGITGLYAYNDNVYVMTRVGNQDWGMQ